MVQHQEEMITRIDTNITDTNLNVEAAHESLLRYFHTISNQNNNQMKELPPMMSTENEDFNSKTQKFKRFTRKNQLGKFPKSCNFNQIKCPSNGKCIRFEDLCDDVDDCYTKVDENETFCFFYLPPLNQPLIDSTTNGRKRKAEEIYDFVEPMNDTSEDSFEIKTDFDINNFIDNGITDDASFEQYYSSERFFRKFAKPKYKTNQNREGSYRNYIQI
ncbi:hypothetical protein RND71_043432 [Anisodus tanguticus]|uniref:t-SNARE coiled-coil homology domain-containing protein n=1 Tax=Anisodus tanguticus TaxID=243964 RepID=A0AAE1QPY2_9SOLA|nr:hypothetical protein RND71_043432 [Anisodus tanguticus]